MKKVLFITTEIFPLLKAGGLGDFSYGFTQAIKRKKWQPIVLIPGYTDLLEKIPAPEVIFEYSDQACRTRILQSVVPGSQVRLWIVDCPELFGFKGNPYTDENGEERSDTAIRFAHFCRIATDVALDKIHQQWLPDVAHCNDWQTGLVPAFLSHQKDAPANIFTIHNLGYQGNFPGHYFESLALPPDWRHFEFLEFYGQLSFIKGGLVFANRLTTVSPTYAKEIQTAAFGCGMQDLLRSRQTDLAGILNGIDDDEWNPACDKYIKYHYAADSLENKAKNKLALQKQLELPSGKSSFLIGFIGRMAQQKGIELLCQSILNHLDEPIQWVVLGCGSRHHEEMMKAMARQFPLKVSVHTHYDEAMAHQIEAAADALLMPSYYEPCGLNQMYSLRYATIPIASHTGGLADSICPVDEETIRENTATGFLFSVGSQESLDVTIDDATRFFKNKKIWKQLQLTAMQQDFSWDRTIDAYLDVYQRAIAARKSVEKKTASA